jgi:hypothetical protein
MSDRAITQDLMARLKRHYIKPGQPFAGGVFIPECGLNGQTSRRCDALYVGFTSTSGRMLVGHEVKASRADWLHELDQIAKADLWADQCHEWWLVAAPGVVHDGELPAGWGLMLPGRSTTRMDIKVRAARHVDRQPSWLIVRSLIARLDTLTVGRIAEDSRAAEEKHRQRYNDLLQQERERRAAVADPETKRKADILDRLCAHLGVDVEDFDSDEYVSRDLFAAALSLARAREQLTGWRHRTDAAELRKTADLLDEVTAALQALDVPVRGVA